ncbi:Hypothetical predicted protein [Olea europaea subsp. europaea]|uniref:Ribonuclease H1 N-terminal domain-containing protein n=1 Tax=Olea europaea subsp. europaea TaxID=158383 RepID=A0A8S0RTZ5_OLEEU|nr:Hypothetical predicted protein [Olea europaea subsp. europaea]
MTVWVVFVGRRPGIYNTWGEAKTQVEGFPNNCHKSYDKREMLRTIFKHFALVGLHRRSWYEAKKQVDGFPNNSFRAFKTRDDAEKAVAEFASSSNQVVQNENEDFLDVQLEIQLKISNLKL